MAFNDPQSITIDGTAYSAARVLTGTELGRFVSADSAVSLEVKPPSRGAGARSVTARLRTTKVTSDPLTTVNVRVSDLISLFITRPRDGYTDVEIEKQVVGFFGWLTASSNANLKKLIAGEN